VPNLVRTSKKHNKNYTKKCNVKQIKTKTTNIATVRKQQYKLITATKTLNPEKHWYVDYRNTQISLYIVF